MLPQFTLSSGWRLGIQSSSLGHIPHSQPPRQTLNSAASKTLPFDMKKELRISAVEDGTFQMVPIRSELPKSHFTFWLESVATTGGFPFIFVPCWPRSASPGDSLSSGVPADVAKSKLCLLLPVLQRALAEAQKRAQRRQREVEREKRMEQLGSTLTEIRTLTELLPLCWSFSV